MKSFQTAIAPLVKLPPVGGWMCYLILRFAYTAASRLDFSICSETLLVAFM